MPEPDEIRRQQTPPSRAMQEFLAGVPKLEFDPMAMRHRLTERFQEYMETPPEPDKDHPYVRDTAP